MMRRRIGLLLALVVGLLVGPLAADTPPTATRRRIGLLTFAASALLRDTFQQHLHDLGYIEGHTLAVEARDAGGTVEHLPDLAAELVQREVEVIVAGGYAAVHAAQQATSRMLGVRLHPLEVHDADAIERAFATMRQERVEALITVGDVFTLHHRTQIVTLAAQHQLPAIYELNAFVAAGGLIAYGPRFEARIRRVVGYVEQILHGAQPADLPVEQPTTFELVVNVKAAEALGLTMPPWLLFEADEVIRWRRQPVEHVAPSPVHSRGAEARRHHVT